MNTQAPTLEDMEAAFNKVENPTDWRSPIFAFIPKTDFDLVKDAVMFYTATVLEVVGIDMVDPDGVTVVAVKSMGYRAGPAGDH